MFVAFRRIANLSSYAHGKIQLGKIRLLVEQIIEET